MTRFLLAAALAASITTVSALVAQQGPPPEIRALIDGLVQAVNGDAAAWEGYAQQYFAPAYLKAQTPDERVALQRQIIERYGTIARGPVRREGPEGPLEITVKGSKDGGVIAVFVDDTTFRVTRISLDAAASSRRTRSSVPPVPLERGMTSQDISERLDRYLTGLAGDEALSGVVLVAKNGASIFAKAYNFADRENKVRNAIDTRFNIGSIQKAFTQIAVHQLIRGGKLSRTDTLGTFFPDYPQAASRGATIEQLLGHRGGLPDFFGPQFADADKKRFASLSLIHISEPTRPY